MGFYLLKDLLIFMSENGWNIPKANKILVTMELKKEPSQDKLPFDFVF